ncbi:uncharacterized protein PgNI_09111 [Pyricularia grisea]|uniref:Uncharacterized protein n=1 Tax=Pyricularia grisea TaxID=148305 RepID=A0A6P8AT77_PYRGI|nr:uncharacterized protein PgNI_09111 [Pyricularia grisea]TLD05313.1 hypothetical protein PgNI_09111 [Pyricularia grisea]
MAQYPGNKMRDIKPIKERLTVPWGISINEEDFEKLTTGYETVDMDGQWDVLFVSYLGIKSSLRNTEIWYQKAHVPFLMSTASVFITKRAAFSVDRGNPKPQARYMDHFSTCGMSLNFVDRDRKPTVWVYPPVPGQT